MELESVVCFLEAKTILVTGATGYLAKVFVEKILRIQPNVKKFYLLLRAEDTKSAIGRLYDEVIGKDLFRIIREKWGASLDSFVSEKLIAVSGDVSCNQLGVYDPYLLEQMQREIDMVVNFAATTNFDERYDFALATNTFGALNVLNFSKKCVSIKLLVHVSTAYVCGEDVGLISENPSEIGKAKRGTSKISIEGENNLVEEKLYSLQTKVDEEAITLFMKDLGTNRAKFFGWPNTYVFTKAMGEMILMKFKDDLPLLIVRPTVITSTCQEPFPGWIEGRVRNIDSIIMAYGRGWMTFFPVDLLSILDLIPADMVVNAMIVAMVARAKKYSENIVYHIGSSARNPTSISNLYDLSFRYFTEKPWIKEDGKPVHISRMKIFPNMTYFHLYVAIRFLLPLKALEFATTLSFQKYQGNHNVLQKGLKKLMRMAELYRPYLFFHGIFDDTNLEKLRILAREANPSTYHCLNFDCMAINWENYVLKVHIPAIVKHVTST